MTKKVFTLKFRWHETAIDHLSQIASADHLNLVHCKEVTLHQQ